MNKKVVFGGGCFWCTEAMFRELDGVLEVKSGYSGGKVDNPTYREVCYGKTGHAEVIEVTYDPEIIHFEDLIIIHMTTHDPTTLNSQGADRGTQYRSIVFYENEEERMVTEEVIKEVSNAYTDEIVTEVVPFEKFFEAESDHQDYYNKNSDAGYCQAVINPKLTKFRKIFNKHLRLTGA